MTPARPLAALLTGALLLAPLPALAAIGGSVEACKAAAEQPGVHHVRLWLDHGVLVQESWWLDAMHPELWPLKKARTLWSAIMPGVKRTKEWRDGKGIDDDVLCTFADGSQGEISFKGEGEVETVGVRGAKWDPKRADGYQDLTIEVETNRERRAVTARNLERLARGINFDVAIYKTKTWGANLKPEHARAAKAAGFTCVRLPIPWARFTAKQAPYTIDPAFFKSVDAAVALIRAAGLAVILDNHEDEALCADPAANRKRLEAMSRQIGDHFQDAPEDVIFEVFAEPHGALEKVWNDVFADALYELRYHNDTRTVVVGPAFYNNVKHLPDLQLPPDDGLVVCVHDYRPLRFTFQGMPLPGIDTQPWLGTRFEGTPAERQAIAADLDEALAWGKLHQRPMFLEEFGSPDTADHPSRLRHTALYREEAEKRGLPWCIWALGPTYPVYDLKAGRWLPGMLGALFPKKTD